MSQEYTVSQSVKVLFITGFLCFIDRTSYRKDATSGLTFMLPAVSEMSGRPKFQILLAWSTINVIEFLPVVYTHDSLR